MPTYEMSLLLRTMTRPEVVSTLKRTAEAIFEKGGFLRKLNSFGTRDLPYRISVHGLKHNQASYFVFEFDSPPTAISDLSEGYGRDVDIIRRRIMKVRPDVDFQCTIEDEMKPPAYRQEVIKMVEEGRKKLKPGYNYNTGLDYYPFQK